jgi:hypothetical protein
VTIDPGPPLVQSTAHQTLRRLLGRSTAREGVFVSKKVRSRSATRTRASDKNLVKVRSSRKVPRPLSTFADALLSALSTPWSQKLRAERWSSFKIQHIAHLVLSSSSLSSCGTSFAQAVFYEIEYRWSNEMYTRISVPHPLNGDHGKVRRSSQNQDPISAQALSTPPFELDKAGYRRNSA